MPSHSLIDHFNLPVSNMERSRVFYCTVLAQFGVNELVVEDEVVGFGRIHWELGIESVTGAIIPLHVAFTADSKAVVNKVYEIALGAGGIDNGAPGFRPEYGQAYYSAYFLDFDQHNLEVVVRNG